MKTYWKVSRKYQYFISIHTQDSSSNRLETILKRIAQYEHNGSVANNCKICQPYRLNLSNTVAQCRIESPNQATFPRARQCQCGHCDRRRPITAANDPNRNNNNKNLISTDAPPLWAARAILEHRVDALLRTRINNIVRHAFASLSSANSFSFRSIWCGSRPAIGLPSDRMERRHAERQ